MAQSFAMECPATPERVDQCPATPDFVRRRIKSPENTSSSDESTFLSNNRTATGSPPPNCAICLGKCKNKCFTDSCLHQFCFKCLLEWSKVKAECPLCKQSFKSIIHNVKSDDQFEEYLVQSPPNSFQISDFSRPMRAHIQIPNRGFFSAAMHPPSNTINQLRSNISTRFRRYVYDGGLYALPLPDVTGRFRECSARFYRENISQVHRLMPWLNRELVCLLNQTSNETGTLLCLIHDLLTIFNINSPDFRRRVLPYLENHTAHFIHEFLNFARSPYDMIGYDREVRYAINPNDDEVIINGTSSSSDSDDIAEVSTGQQISSGSLYNRRQRNNNGVGLTIEATNNPNSTVSTVHIIIGDGDSNASNNSNISTSNIGNQASQLTAINLSTNNNSSIIPNNVTTNQNDSEVRILNDTPIEITETNQILQQNNDDRISLHSSASSDTCEFVLERKPPHLRTPEMVSLDSDSDSDVVFVSEQKQNEDNASNGPAPGTSGVSFRVGRQTRLKSSRMRNIRGIFTVSSDVDHSSDSDFKPPIETRSSRPRKLRTRQSTRNSKDKSEPSTSSGITGSGKPMSLLYSASSSRSKRKKHSNSKSESSGNRNRPCGGRGYKTIYESSTSSETESSRHESDDDDHKSSSSDDENKIEEKPSKELLSTSSSSNTSDSTRSSSSSSNKSNDNKKHKNKIKDQNNKSNNREKISTRRSTRSSSSSSKTSFSLTTEENRSRSSSSTSSTSSSCNSSSSSSNSSSGSSSKSSTTISSDTTSDSSKSSIKQSKSNRKNVKHEKTRSNKKHNKLSNKSKNNKVHSMRNKKKDQNTSSKSKKDSKKNKRIKKNSRTKINGSFIKKEHKNKKQKDKKRKRKLSSKTKSNHSTTEFSVSDIEPLAKHVKVCKNELVSSENEQEHSEANNIENESYLNPDYQQEQLQQYEQLHHEQEPETEQQQFPNSILLCFPNDVQMPMNLSTTEQIPSEPPPSPLLFNNAQQEAHLLPEGHN